MIRRVVFWAVLACGAFGARSAMAGPKVDFLCGVYVNAAIADLVPNAKNPKIDKPVACVLHLPGTSKVVYKGTITTRRHMVNPVTDDSSDVEMMGEGGELSHKPGADAVDVEVIMTPGKENSAGDVPFDVCESFDIVGTVTDAKGIVFQKVLKVVQKCPKAKAAPPAPAPPPERRAPPPAPPPAAGGTVDDLITYREKQSWSAYDFQMDSGMVYAIAACFDPGTTPTCDGAVISDKGKVLMKLDGSITTDGELDPARIAAMRASVGKVVAGNSNSNKLVEHVLGAKQFTWDTIGFKWNEKAKTLTVLNGKKTFKTVNVKKLIGPASSVNQVAVYLFEAGSPPAAIVRLTYTGMAEAIEDTNSFFTVQLPALAGD